MSSMTDQKQIPKPQHHSKKGAHQIVMVTNFPLRVQFEEIDQQKAKWRTRASLRQVPAALAGPPTTVVFRQIYTVEVGYICVEATLVEGPMA
jgi:hypothetical protein